MENLVNGVALEQLLGRVETWARQQVFVTDTLVEVGVVVLAALIAWALTPYLRRRTVQLEQRHAAYTVLSRLWHKLGLVMWPLLWLGLQWIGIFVTEAFGWRSGLLLVTASLLSAWVVIRIASSFVRDPFVGRTIATLAWVIAALNILGLLDQAVAALDGIAMSFGGARISAYTVIKGLFALTLLLWLSSLLSNVFESRIRALPNVTPSAQVLFSKLFKITLIVVAFVAAISSVGIDLTAFAVFGGAIGVGVGFGLQKIVSNLISGVILLVDKSIKPGDVIAFDDHYGRVDSLGARYVSVTTRDGIEHLIPNEDLIVNRVENWSHSQNLYRLKIGVGVHYGADVPRAMALCLEAADECPRALPEPPPVCLLRGFGDSSVDLEIRCWIDDPMEGRANVSSDIYLRLWKKFHAEGIEIPYPQRDLHIRTPDLRDADAARRMFAGEEPGGAREA
ncbi:MAG: mechanosensitive ion channel family protein [Gammaproteobacteria bacterium]